MRIFTFFVIALLALPSCFQEKESIPLEDLYGQWRGQTWLVKGEESGRDVGAVRFTFNPDSTYSAMMGSNGEKGIFRIEGNLLYTTAKGDAEKSVELSTVNADSIVMKMNRQGDIETLVLVKQ